MGRKRKAALPFCYYCSREFEDEKVRRNTRSAACVHSLEQRRSTRAARCPQVLLQHQKAKHFRCGSCNKQWPNIGAMKLHALKSHGETVLKVRFRRRRGFLSPPLRASALRCAR